MDVQDIHALTYRILIHLRFRDDRSLVNLDFSISEFLSICQSPSTAAISDLGDFVFPLHVHIDIYLYCDHVNPIAQSPEPHPAQKPTFPGAS